MKTCHLSVRKLTGIIHERWSEKGTEDESNEEFKRTNHFVFEINYNISTVQNVKYFVRIQNLLINNLVIK